VANNKRTKSQALEDLKMEVANETLGRDLNQQVTAENYEALLEKKKQAVTQDLGLDAKVNQVGWENMTTKEVGKIGGRVGGKIGGNMVKKLIEAAETQMAPVAKEAIDKNQIESVMDCDGCTLNYKGKRG